VIPSVFRFEGDGSLKDRLLTALLVLVTALALSVLAIYVPYGGLICVAWTAAVAALSTFEVVRLFARSAETLHYKPVLGVVMFTILILPALAATYSAASGVLGAGINLRVVYGALLVSGQCVLLGQVLSGRHRLEDASHYAQRWAPSFLLLGVCASQLIVIGGSPHGVRLLWWIAGVAALNDAAAYFAGKAFGKHKVAPGLSPNKSVEGSVAGVVVGTAAGVLLWQGLLGAGVPVYQRALVSLAMVIAAQCGDLAKSYLKRLRGVKDTGAFFPGHGGVLDRFDAMIAAAPVVVVALSLMGLL
jgi:phosphatidate cytidylyltransferase